MRMSLPRTDWHDGLMAINLTRPQAPGAYEKLPQLPGFTLTSDDIVDGQTLPDEFTAGGDNTSPHLEWSGFPEETESFLLVCFDPDAPIPSGWWHWAVVDLDASVTELPRGAGASDLELPGAAFHLRNDGGEPSYGGAAPPPGDHLHRYTFAVHALNTDTLEVDPDSTIALASFTALFHTIARAELTTTYQR